MGKKRSISEWIAYADSARKAVVRQLREFQVRIESEPYQGEFDANLLRCDPIDRRALQALDGWDRSERPHKFDWEYNWQAKHKDPSWFDFSIWYEGRLCALCYAKAVESSVIVELKLLEASPDPGHPLAGRVITMAILTLKQYCKFVKASQLVIYDYLDDAESKYVDAGFDLVDGKLVYNV